MTPSPRPKWIFSSFRSRRQTLTKPILVQIKKGNHEQIIIRRISTYYSFP
jgi:hypothetical protein